mgnify:CR=1 FL=1
MEEWVRENDIAELWDGILDEKCKLEHFKRIMDGYVVHIICCQFSSELSLKSEWEQVMYNVAEIVQKRLKKLIEIYNVYIIFFQENISTELMANIEQNKYSSRKIVLRNNMPESSSEMLDIVNEKLFELEIKGEDRDETLLIKQFEFLTDDNSDKWEIQIKNHIDTRVAGKTNEKNQ